MSLISGYRPILFAIDEEPSYEDLQRAVIMCNQKLQTANQNIDQVDQRIVRIMQNIHEVKGKFYYTEWYKQNDATRCCFRACPHWTLLFPLSTAILGIMMAIYPEIVMKGIGPACIVSGVVGCASTYYFAWGNMSSLYHIENFHGDLEVLRTGTQRLYPSIEENSASNSSFSIDTSLITSDASQDTFFTELKM